MDGLAVIKRLTDTVAHSAAVLKPLSEPLLRVLTFNLADNRVSPSKALSVAIERSGVSVAYASRFLSRLKIKRIKRYSSDGQVFPQPEEFASSVALAANEFKARKVNVTLSIPKAWAIIKTVEFPSTVRENIPDVLAYEMDRITPFSAEESYYDYRMLNEDADKVTLLVAAARADAVTPYLDALAEKGLPVKGITLNLSGMGNLCHFVTGERKYIFMEIHENSYEGALFRDGSLGNVFSGSFTSTDDTSKVEEILRGMKSLKNNAPEIDVSTPVIVSLKNTGPTFKELLRVRMGMPTRLLDETDLRLRIPGDRREIPYAALGAAVESLWPKAKRLNLLEKALHERTRTPIALTIVLVLAIIGLLVLYVAAPLRTEEKRLQEIDRQISGRKDEVRKVEALKKEIEALSSEIAVIEAFKQNRPMTMNILKELTTILPKSTWLTRARIAETTVEIEGYASSATELLPKLEASKYFQKVEFASPTYRDARMNAERFIIKMEIEGIKKAEGDKVKHETKK